MRCSLTLPGWVCTWIFQMRLPRAALDGAGNVQLEVSRGYGYVWPSSLPYDVDSGSVTLVGQGTSRENVVIAVSGPIFGRSWY